jgi:hypothetical protein
MLRVVLWNSNRFSGTKPHDLAVFAERRHPHIVVITEPKLKPGSAPPSLKGYVSFFVAHPSGHAGLLIFVVDHLAGRTVTRPAFSYCDSASSPFLLKSQSSVLSVELYLPSLRQSVVFCAVYRAPPATVPDWDILAKRALVPALQSGKVVFLLGDFNARHASWDPVSTVEGNLIARFFEDNDLTCLNCLFARNVKMCSRNCVVY